MKADGGLIEVALALPVFQTFTYRVPSGLDAGALVGKRVIVPLGGADHSQRRVSGYVLGPGPPAGPDGKTIKQVAGVIDATPLFPADMVPFFRWIADYYLYPLGQVIATALPVWPAKGETAASAPATRRVARLLRADLPDGRHRPKRRQLIDALATHGPLPAASLKALCPQAFSSLAYLERHGFVAIDRQPLVHDPFGEPIVADSAPALNGEQAQVVQQVLADLGVRHRTFLLAGVTGSGKTEVYLHLAATALAKGLTALVLVPEIALMAQITRRFRARFGRQVALLHSGLTAAERRDQWRRIAEGQAPVVIGARSALFAPLTRLGLIVVDEEHDPSYKQENGLRYNARDLAVVRAKQCGAVALLGSATPSIQTQHNALNAKFTPLRLTRRVLERPLPKIEVVDLRDNRGVTGDLRLISPRLRNALAETLAQGRQALLFLNRRGFAPHPICAACGQGLRCRHCDVSLTLHQAANAFRCHFCGYSQTARSRCPFCGSDRIKALGLGTEKLEQLLRGLFPQARVARLDRDTTMARGALLNILKDVHTGAIDILVGTQMVAKGHDFPNITLVGIVCADLSLNVPDFRAGERTFQLLAQVAGRAGRGDAPGHVILQTFNPAHFGIQTAQAQDVDAFFAHEIAFRRQLRYPPFARLALLTVSGRDIEGTKDHAARLGRCLLEVKSALEVQGVEVLGPAEAALARLAGRHRWQVLIKARAGGALNRLIRALMGRHPEVFRHKTVRVTVDIDPMEMT